MKSIFAQKIAKKQALRRKASEAMANNSSSALQRNERNFCMSGADLGARRRADGHFKLF